MIFLNFSQLVTKIVRGTIDTHNSSRVSNQGGTNHGFPVRVIDLELLHFGYRTFHILGLAGLLISHNIAQLLLLLIIRIAHEQVPVTKLVLLGITAAGHFIGLFIFTIFIIIIPFMIT